MMKTASVLGGGGFIGSHLITRLKEEGYKVFGYDQKFPEFGKSDADIFQIQDLRVLHNVGQAMERTDEVYQLAADMGGAGFVFTGKNDADIMLNSAQINLNVAHFANTVGKVFFSSSACIYPAYNQEDAKNPTCSEESAYPADPDSEYGWEKLFSERVYAAIERNKGADIRIARFHNVYGPNGTYKGGREKAPAALCRKVIEAPEGSPVEIWGDGEQTRSFMYIDDCVEGIFRMMHLPHFGSFPLNLGSEEMVSINELARRIIRISGKKLDVEHVPGPEGVRGRNSDNRRLRTLLDWEPCINLNTGLELTYRWIEEQISKHSYLIFSGDH